jgi:hypothetical protein
MIYYMTIDFCFFPMCAAMIAWMTSKCLLLRGWREWAWILLTWIVVLISVVPIGYDFLDRFLGHRAMTSTTHLVVFIIFNATIWALTALARLLHGRKRRRLDAMLVHDMEIFRKDCSEHSRESLRLRLEGELHVTETDTPYVATLGDGSSDNIQDGEDQPPDRLLNQPFPHTVGKS